MWGSIWHYERLCRCLLSCLGDYAYVRGCSRRLKVPIILGMICFGVPVLVVPVLVGCLARCVAGVEMCERRLS